MEKNLIMNKWKQLSQDEKIKLVDTILEIHVRPMIASHGGGVQVLDVKDNEVMISYQGACAGCWAATSSTLSFIDETLKTNIDKDIFVTPIF